MTMNNFCRNCGHLLDEETGFCPQCEAELLSKARNYLPADDDKTIFIRDEELGAVQVSADQKWRHDFLDESLSGGPLTPSCGERKPPKTKRKILPVVLGILVVFLAGAGAVWFVTGGQDSPGEQSTATAAPEPTTEDPVQKGFTGNEEISLEGYDIEKGRDENGRPIARNQLIITCEDGVDEDRIDEIKELTEAEVVGRNGYDQSVLIQWSEDQMKEKSVEERKDELSREKGYEVSLNYLLESCKVKKLSGSERAELPGDRHDWNMEDIEAEKLKKAAEDAIEDETGEPSNIGFVLPSDSGDEAGLSEGIIGEILPDSWNGLITAEGFSAESYPGEAGEGSGVGEPNSVYAFTAQLTDLLVGHGGKDPCRVICCPFVLPLNGDPGEEGTANASLEGSLKKLDDKMEMENASSPDGADRYRCLICFPSGERGMNEFWKKMSCICGVGVGSVEWTGEGLYKASSYADTCSVMAPDVPVRYDYELYDGNGILAVAHVAGFAADIFSMDPGLKAKKCGKKIYDGADITVEGSDKKMINGRKIVYESNSDADGNQRDDISEQ